MAAIEAPPGFQELAIEEKIAYVQALWDLIVSRPDEVPVPEWHRAVVAERRGALGVCRSSAMVGGARRPPRAPACDPWLMLVELTRAAEADVGDAAVANELERPGLGFRFEAEVDRVLAA